jgi:hypothetical protein
MRPQAQFFSRQLSLYQAALVLLTVVLLGVGGWAVSQWVAGRLLAARVESALPRVFGQLRADRQALDTAIEAYRSHFGFYPPDHLLARKPLSVDPITNTLIYELFGTLHNLDMHTYTPQGLDDADELAVRSYFQSNEFKNFGARADQVTQFLRPESLLARKVRKGPDLYLPGSHLADVGFAPGVFEQFQITSWRYVASSPTNNPLKFDLWVELKAGGRGYTLGNWRAAQ